MHGIRKLSGAGVALALVLAAPAVATAAPPAAPAAATGAPSASPTSRTTTTVTLLSGDRVTVTASGGASVRPAPGREHIRFLTSRQRGQLTVVPRDALPLIHAGRVDRRLFDVSGLIAVGYDDARRDHLPVLFTPSSSGAARRATAPAGVTVTRDLPAIGGFAGTAAKQRTADVWAALTGRAGARVDTAEDVDRIWLDGRRQVTLDHSVPQIGAPAAHRAGYTGRGVRVAVLDTGVDAGHPDLAGRVAEARNFTEESAPGDVVGHGTHVASIIAGSGAASGGRYRGVAPDATLLSGKVCEVFGCTDSAILAGMQWAAVEQNADVINFSIGGTDTPEVDPVEEAVNRLTAQTGALFVVSAGNDGGFAPVSSPATADAALAVGAVDRDDALADFSSRGPRTGDDALKPDLTAPGVEIVAARAADGVIGDPAGEGYVSLSGTSMAAPHVTGAVALLAQQHTGWVAGQLKATLMASAKPHPEQTAYEQGAGRVDVARAITQTVTSDPASVSFGRAIWPHHDDTPVTRQVTWRNDGPVPVTLDLAVEATGPAGTPAPAGMFGLSANRITVPAGGAATAEVTADTRTGGADGHYTGRIVARSGDAVAVTPFAVHQEVESYTLTVRHLDESGAVTGDYFTTLAGLESFGTHDVYDPDGTAELRLPKGRYGLSSFLYSGNEEDFRTALIARPELVFDRDTVLTVDARQAKPVRTTVPDRTATPVLVDVGANFVADDGSSYGFTMLGFDFAGLSTGQLGPAGSAESFLGTVSSQWADREAASSPYLYALSEGFPGRLPAGFDRHYRSRDLATVTHRFRGGYPGLETERVVFPHLEPDVGGWAAVLRTAVPGQRVEHYNTRGVRWSSELAFGVRSEDGWLDARAVLVGEARSHRAGRHQREDWNAAPYGPSFPAPRWPGQGITRTGDVIMVDVPLHSDAAGHAGGSLPDSARTALYRNGTLVGENAEPGYGAFEVPPGAAGYRLETVTKRSFTDLSTEVGVAWTFRSRHVSGDDFARLPAMAVRFAPPLDVANTAPAGRSFSIPVRVERQPGAPAARVAALTVEVSYDGGTTWQRALVRPGHDGWTASVRHPAGAGYASLRATARDTAGNTVTQHVIQAYRLR
ncbi:S8 family serine peptidase [Micromonospora sp. WMMD812]|uniref:S8 family serine peptidase n=1 Tax=Micromonospora sp. WMMD812 TaxID=3015152 RepID=UPI00248ADC8B|nr:S8 family serine peptidase [Micromonospora sp. WMMD812]WBB66558.1 S8 family serine peptidase [Micromonospora sp. WMMD812]